MGSQTVEKKYDDKMKKNIYQVSYDLYKGYKEYFENRGDKLTSFRLSVDESKTLIQYDRRSILPDSRLGCNTNNCNCSNKYFSNEINDFELKPNQLHEILGASYNHLVQSGSELVGNIT